MNIEDSLTRQTKDGERSYSEIVLDKQKGREWLNTIYPSEFEYYACALEITDQDGNRIEFFSFPMMPNSISENRNSITNIKKTMGGVVVTSNSTFIPFDISISGNFGRKFRKILHVDNDQVSHSKMSDKAISNSDGINGIYDGGELSGVKIKPIFSTDYKTGYGCIKILEKIFLRSQSTDLNRKPLRLFFYNLSLNSNYLVEPINISITQNKDQNMIWNYSLQLKAIAPAKYIFSNYRSSLKELRSYNKKFVRMTEESSLINEILKDVINGQTPVQSALNQFKNNKAYGTQSAFKLLKQMTDNPLEAINSIR